MAFNTPDESYAPSHESFDTYSFREARLHPRPPLPVHGKYMNRVLPVIESTTEPSAGTARYSTMKSLYRGRDESRKRAQSLHRTHKLKPETKQMMDLKMPKISFEPNTEKYTCDDGLKNLSPKYVDTVKKSMQLRGLDVPSIFAHNRNKADRSLVRKRYGASPRRYLECAESDFVPHTLREVFQDTYNHGDTDSAYNSSGGDAEENQLERTFEEKFKDSVENLGQVKRRGDKKLGSIVSSYRLSQLLNSEKPLKMENFYNYYPAETYNKKHKRNSRKC